MINTDDDKMEIEAQDELELTGPPYPEVTDMQVRIAKEQSSVDAFLRKERSGELVLAPDFQRKDVWDKKHQSELIESILLGIPIPLIYLFENEQGERQIIDGKQRVTTLKLFMNNELALTSLFMLPTLKGARFDDIPPLLQAKLEDYLLHYYVIQPPTPEHVKFNIFERINRGGVSLNKQEMRHALYQGKATSLIQELAESEAFKNATGNGVKANRMRDRYLILRFIAFSLYHTEQLPGIEYHSDVDSFLAATMKYINTASSEFIELIKERCLSGLTVIYKTLGAEAFRFEAKETSPKRPINMGLFEMLLFVFSQLDSDDIDKQKIRLCIEQYKSAIDAEGIFAGGIDSTASVEIRFNWANKIIQGLKHA